MADSERALEELFRGVAPRTEPPAEVRDRVLAAVEQEWRKRQKRRLAPPLAAAAAVALVVLVGLSQVGRGDTFPVQLAATQSLWVAGQHLSSGGTQLRLAADTAMVADRASRLVTDGGSDLRLRAGTEIRWLGPEAVALLKGSVYVGATGRNFRISTPMGTVTDIGTRFMVTLDDGAMEVAMRDGITRIATDHGTYTATGSDFRGDVVRVTSDRTTARTDLASADRWGWIHEVNPGYSSKAVPELLDVIALDLGQPLVFASPAVQKAVASLEVEGQLSNLRPEQALRVVLRTSGLVQKPDAEGRLLVDLQ